MEKDWNPELYLRFESERTRPAIELLSRIDISNPSVVAGVWPGKQYGFAGRTLAGGKHRRGGFLLCHAGKSPESAAVVPVH